jgi:hypothetical protein
MPAGLLKNQRQEIGADQVGLPTLPQCISVAIHPEADLLLKFFPF